LFKPDKEKEKKVLPVDDLTQISDGEVMLCQKTLVIS